MKADGAEVQALLVKIGQAVAQLHDGGVVHGDLTTSNMIIRDADKRVVSFTYADPRPECCLVP